jgi:hypothetical protein
MMTLSDARESRHPELYGVRGWLGFLCLKFMFLSPAVILIQLAMNWRAITAGAEPAIAETIVLAAIGWGVFIGIRLNQIHPRAIRLAKIYFAIFLALDGLGSISLVFNSQGIRGLSTVSGAVTSALWLAYLYRSERVRNTFAPAAAEKISDVFA